MTDRDEDNAVGYGKPPKEYRFKKGQSGNPKGRPKGSLNFDNDVDDILRQPMTISENGDARTVSSQKAALLRLRTKALKGDPRALDRLLTLAAENSARKEANSAERALTANEEEILERFAEHIQRRPPEEEDGNDD